MFAIRLSLIIGIGIFLISACKSQTDFTQQPINPGALQISEYLPLIQGKSIGLVVNQSSIINGRHLVDTLLGLKQNIKAIFAPEHGFRGDAYDGEVIYDTVDPVTKLPIVSLYRSNKKPSAQDLQGIDIMIYDIQDVGARFYTFISTMHYVMEACAESNIPVIILDRPNPNGHYVDGPVLDTAFRSFIGMNPIPIVYGLTNGELAQMINGESWLSDSVKCELNIIKIENYSHKSAYELPIAPSPNLPNAKAINLYPSLCLLEPTVVSIGRGTTFPFQVVGIPDSTNGNFRFTPVSIDGVSKYPKHQDMLCYGQDLRNGDVLNKIDLSHLVNYYQKINNKEKFYRSTDYFDKLAGTDLLRKQLEQGLSAEEITQSWQPSLVKYKKMRKKYLLYPDFE